MLAGATFQSMITFFAGQQCYSINLKKKGQWLPFFMQLLSPIIVTFTP